MLVVTIIIAAVVSGFVGRVDDLAGTRPRPADVDVSMTTKSRRTRWWSAFRRSSPSTDDHDCSFV